MSRRLVVFALTSLAGLGLMTAALILLFQGVAERDMRDILDARNELLAKAVSRSIQVEGLVEILNAPTDQRGSELMQRPVVAEFHRLVSERIEGLPMILVTFYNADGTVVYSTNREQIGDAGSHDRAVIDALGGRASSRLTLRAGYNVLGPHGAVRDVDIYRSYLPIRSLDATVGGVLEIHSDASAMLLGRMKVERTVVSGVISIAGLFYGALFLLFRRTDAALAREAIQRDHALAEVRAAKDQLETRVAERTRELQASESFLQSVIDGVGDPILVINRDYEVTALNDAARRMGVSEPADVAGVPCYQLSHHMNSPCSTQDKLCLLHLVLESGSLCKVIHNHIRDGEKRIVEVTATPLRDDTGTITGIVEVEHDITELIATSQKLVDSEQRFLDLSDTSAEYIWELDHLSRFTFVSDRVRDVLGYEPSELIGRTPASLMPAEDAEQIRKYFEKRGEGKPFNNLQHRSIRKDGRLVWQSVSSVPVVGADGEPLRARGVCQDITDRKLAEEKLGQSEAHLRSILDNVVDAILTFDEVGRILSANRAAEKMFGGSAAELQEELVASLIPDIVEVLEPAVPGPALHRYREGQREAEGLRRDGSSFPIDLWVGRMEIEGARLQLAVVHDATQAKHVQRQLEQARLQYYHREKIAAIGDLAAGILHEVNNPITAISGSLDELREIREGVPESRDRFSPSSAALHHFGMIENQLQSLSRVTQEIAEFASPLPKERELVDLNQIVRSTLQLMRYDRRLQRAELRADLDKMLPAVMGVAEQLMQMLMNLLLNAAEASENASGHNPVIEIRTTAQGQDVLICVEDDCGGMEAEVAASCTAIFYTTKPPGKGTGLGLTICESIVHRHGGSMEIESVKSKGTTIRIRIPTRSLEA